MAEHRVDEVPQSVRDRLAEALAARLRSRELVEAYRRITTAEAGYTGFRRAAETPFNLIYEVRP